MGEMSGKILVCLCVALLVASVAATKSKAGKCPFGHGAKRTSRSAKSSVDEAAKGKRSLQDGNDDNDDKNIDIIIGNAMQAVLGQGSDEDNTEVVRNDFELTECGIAPKHCEKKHVFYRSSDGSCNNLDYPEFGIAKSRNIRLIYPHYGDGVSSLTKSVKGGSLPNPRDLSVGMFGETTTLNEEVALITVHFGHTVTHDLTDFDLSRAPEDCCESKDRLKCAPFELHKDDPITEDTGDSCHNFRRATFDREIKCQPSDQKYAEKINVQTPYLDLSQVYGASEEEFKDVRAHKQGLLKVNLNENHQPFAPVIVDSSVDGRSFDIPDGRQQMVPGTAVMHTIFLREHNRLAYALVKLNPHYDDERLFQEARKINIAQYQKITYYEYLPQVLGRENLHKAKVIHDVDSYDYIYDYDHQLKAAIYAEFSAAAFRYLHNTIPGWFTLLNFKHYTNDSLRISDFFQDPKTTDLLMGKNNFDDLIRGLVNQPLKIGDDHIDTEIKNHLFREKHQEFGRDLKAIDIQRARDFGIAPYNLMRTYAGLPRVYDWEGFHDVLSEDVIKRLKHFYKCPDDVDLNVAGHLEADVPGSEFGPTLQSIMERQFYALRTGDRFFFENGEKGGLSRQQLHEIRKVSLASLLCLNADYLEYIQPDAFETPSSHNKVRSCHHIPHVDLTKWID